MYLEPIKMIDVFINLKDYLIMIDTYNNPPEELENECAFCGEPCSKTYCNSDCRKAYEREN